MSLRVLDPTQSPEVMPITLAERRASYRDVVLGMLSNGKSNATALMQLVKDRLADSLSVQRVVVQEKESASTNAPAEMVDRLVEEVDVALVAIGD